MNRDTLKQEPSGDLISREETLTAFADYVGSGMSMDDYDALWNIVAKMPAVNPTKTGHWIRHDNGKYHLYLCSCCDAMAGSDEKKMAYKYCPNCGCRMVESQESEE